MAFTLNNKQYEEITNNLLISNIIRYDNKCPASAPR